MSEQAEYMRRYRLAREVKSLTKVSTDELRDRLIKVGREMSRADTLFDAIVVELNKRQVLEIQERLTAERREAP